MADRVNVDAELAEILRAIFGKDVRSSIHDGIKAIADGVNKVGNEWDTKVEDGDFEATIDVGKVETGEAGTNVEISNSGTKHNAILDFKIPEGERGIDGVKGDSGVWTGAEEPPADSDYDVWVLPDGTPDYEIEASSIVTMDGGNVQEKLNNTAYVTEAGILVNSEGARIDNAAARRFVKKYKSSVQPITANTSIPLNGIEYTYSSDWFSNSDTIVTLKKAGTYLITVHLLVECVLKNQQVACYLVVNGAQRAKDWGLTESSNGYVSLQIPQFMLQTSTENVTIEVTFSQNGNLNFGNLPVSYMTIEKI